MGISCRESTIIVSAIVEDGMGLIPVYRTRRKTDQAVKHEQKTIRKQQKSAIDLLKAAATNFGFPPFA